jgi:hypothetical protein
MIRFYKDFFGKRELFGVMDILVVVLEMLVVKVLRSIFKNRVNAMFNSSPTLKGRCFLELFL